MAKFTKKQRIALDNILSHLTRAEDYLLRKDVIGIAHENKSPNGASYIIKNPACSEVQAVDTLSKYVGSDITGLYDAKRELTNFLALKGP